MRVLLRILVAILVLGLAVGAYGALTGGRLDRGWVWAVFAIVYFAFLYYVLLPWRIRRIFKQQKSLHDRFILDLGEDELRIDSPRGNFRMKWSDFHKWKMNDKLILLYHSDAVFQMIPARVFSTEQERGSFAQHLERHLGKQRA